jgi:hydrogenase large subunit
MPTTISISPMTRVEGHLDIEVMVDTNGGVQQVTDARAAGQMFRGFERILVGRDPRDAVQLTQRICGVCPISHGMASSLALEQAYAVTPAENGRIVRNLVLGSNYLQSHILHFYHLAAPDYINTDGILDMSPWRPHMTSPDMVTGSTATTLVNHYVQALAMRRKAHQMGAQFAGHMPITVNFLPGGATKPVTAADITAFRALLTELRSFITNIMLADAEALMKLFIDYTSIGRGCGNLLAYGVFDLNSAGTSKLLARGRITDGTPGTVDHTQIREYVTYSWYTDNSGDRTPANGVTESMADKAGAYSWIKAPRYGGVVHEVGPLARMWVNGDYNYGISVMDRIAARVLEAEKVANAMDGWLNQLVPGGPVYTHKATPTTGIGVGLTEAPRGALGHWTQIGGSKLTQYQVVSPTGWNASPMDSSGQHGAIEQALIGTPVQDTQNPIELLRVVHSFDPCLSCSVHLVRPGKKAELCRVDMTAGIQTNREDNARGLCQ